MLKETVDVNGHRFSRTSTAMRVDGAYVLEGWTSWNYKRSLKPGKSYGNKANPQNRTRGKAEYSMDITVYEADYEKLVRYLILKSPTKGLGEQVFQLTGTLFEFDLGSVVIIGERCRITDEDATSGDNDDENMMKLTLDPMKILRNGVPMVSENTPLGI